MNVDEEHQSLLEEIEGIKNDPEISDEDRKKKIRKLRKKIRSMALPSESDEEEALDKAAYIAEVIHQASTLKHFDCRLKSGYGYSLNSAFEIHSRNQALKASDKPSGFGFDDLAQNFKKRFGITPEQYSTIEMGWDTILLLGPTPAHI